MIDIYGKFRCRMCGSVYELMCKTTELGPPMETLKFWVEDNGLPPMDFMRHVCKNGQIGIADFLGASLASSLTTKDEKGGDDD